MPSPDEEHGGRVVQRATSDIASIVAGYRAGDLGFHRIVEAIEVRIGSVDPEWLEEWRSHRNRLEHVNASMIDEQREGSGQESGRWSSTPWMPSRR